MSEISKTELIQVFASGEAITYLGTFEVNEEMRIYYRTTGVSGTKASGHAVIYIVA